jgi:16S rRNA (cytosine967-C5)-methyltransferase
VRYQSYFNSALTIINAYKGGAPLVHHLKQYFAAHKKHGSTDRRTIAHLCYTYYRLGASIKEFDTDKGLQLAIFLCEAKPGNWALLFEPSWIAAWNAPDGSSVATFDQKLDFIKDVYPGYNLASIFAFAAHLSFGVDAPAFNRSHLTQPDLFIRIRPKQEAAVMGKLNKAQITFEKITDTCYRLPSGTKLDEVLLINKEAVIQDYSSQQIAGMYALATAFADSKKRIWDCCAASGGKSILAVDTFGQIKLTASDMRATILRNLQTRFAAAGMSGYQSFAVDLTSAHDLSNFAKLADFIICDAPCTGSGTWGRTPEHLAFFDEASIDNFRQLQQTIISNTIPYVAVGGYFLYSTCSVFAAENEGQVKFIETNFPEFKLLHQQLFTGYAGKADTMFAALFQKK